MSRQRTTRIIVAGAISLAATQTGYAGGPGTGNIPLMDMTGGQTYQGFPGLLYPGSNVPPQEHADDALALAAQIVPRNAEGAPHPNGLIGFVAIGMSNTTHEFSVFERQEDLNTGRNARVVLVNAAQGGQTASLIANPNAPYWSIVSNRLTAIGISPLQVQVAWLKEANGCPCTGFPAHAQQLRSDLESVAQNLHDKFPNLKICYVSSRTYGGWATIPLNPEPWAYETGFSAKWLIEDQINGDPGLNYGNFAGPIESPLLLWGPYLWADGLTPRSDGLVWLQSDFESDGTHPSPTGEQKVANLLSAFFPNEPSAMLSWWPAQGGVSLAIADATDDAYVSSAAPDMNFGAALDLKVRGSNPVLRTYLKFNVAAINRPVRHAKLSLRVLNSAGNAVRLVNNSNWSESTITNATAPPIGGTIATLSEITKDSTLAANVTGQTNADADGIVSFALTTSNSLQRTFHSKEALQPPRLIMIVNNSSEDVSGDAQVDVNDLVQVLSAWGRCPTPAPGCPEDLNHDGQVTIDDVLRILHTWR